MSVESIALIGILTVFTIILGTDLFLLMIGRSVLESINFELLNTLAQGYWMMIWRILFVLCLLLVGAIVVNLTPTTRTEDYLLRIGLGSLCVYLILFLLSLSPVRDRIVSPADTTQLGIAIAYRAWTQLLWPRTIAALVSFWSFLHYAMNPKI